jgi:DNA-binding NtrC family response regulator
VLKYKILLVDDEPGVLFGLQNFLEAKGYEVESVSSCQRAEEVFRAVRPDVAILDYLLPDGTAVELLPRLKSINPQTSLIVLTGHGSIELAVQAIKEGADQFLIKPVELPALQIILERLFETQRNRQKQLAQRSNRTQEEIDPFFGQSPAIRQLAEQAQKLVAADSPTLLLGETGVGKGVLARWLHEHSPRAEESFVNINSAGLSAELLESELFGHERGAFTGATSSKVGLFEVAHRGSVFLDEIGDVPLNIQPKLLKVLEEKTFRRVGEVRDRRVDIRLIAATHQELSSFVKEKKFRSDLYFRINTLPLVVPPLRERRGDISLLAKRFVQSFSLRFGRTEIELTTEGLRALEEYSWPGNIRELKNVLERAVLLCEKGIIGKKELRFESTAGAASLLSDTNMTLEELERFYVERVLKEENGHVDNAAKRLGVPRSSLYQKIKRFGIHPSK